MRKHVVTVVSIFISLSFLTSCATMPGSAAKPGQENAQDQQNAQNAAQKTYQTAAEREILTQSVLTGAAVGAGIGAIAGAILNPKDPVRGAATFAPIGAVIGGLGGAAVGKKQIQDVRDIRLKNDQLEALLRKARDYNFNITSYNNTLQQEIVQLQAMQESERGKKKAKLKEAQEQRILLANEKLKQAEEQKKLVAEASAERKQLTETLVQEQKVRYQETLTELDNENQRLDLIIADLKRFTEPARIGGKTS